jgi:hypothetical protein
MSCGRSDQPERFHTHPAKLLTNNNKSPLKESRHNNNNNNHESSSGGDVKVADHEQVRAVKGGSRSLSPRKPPQPASYRQEDQQND